MIITITVFFNDADHAIFDKRTLASLLKNYIVFGPNQKILSFHGTRVADGSRIEKYGEGSLLQCETVINDVSQEIKKGNIVKLNVYGHGSGAIAALLLSQQLSEVNPQLIDIRLVLLDPIPGNFITTSTFDAFNISLAKKTMDLTKCKPLKRVLALYPYEPLPSALALAPLLGCYPKHTDVEEDVIGGCHSSAQFHLLDLVGNISFSTASFMAFARVFLFLKESGTAFTPHFPRIERRPIEFRPRNMWEVSDVDPATLKEELIKAYRETNAIPIETSRECHSANGLIIHVKRKAEFFNLHHQRLVSVDNDKSHVRAIIRQKRDPIALVKWMFSSFPKTGFCLKWFVVGLCFASLLSITGILGAAVSLIGIGEKIGQFGILLAAPIVGGVFAALWYNALKPLSERAVSRYFYPKFQVHTLLDEKKTTSTYGRLRRLSLEGYAPPALNPIVGLSLVSAGSLQPGHRGPHVIPMREASPTADKSGVAFCP